MDITKMDGIGHSNEDVFSNLQLRLDYPPSAPPMKRDPKPTPPPDRSFVMMEEYYYYDSSDPNNTTSSEFYYTNIRSGKKLTTFSIACVDLGLSCIAGFFEGKSVLYALISVENTFLIISSISALLLTFAWFIAAWKLLESSYLRHRVILRYQLAKFWRLSNIVLLVVFIASSLLANICIFTNQCNIDKTATILHSLQTATGYCVFLLVTFLFCVQRVFSIWFVNRYIDELENDLSSDSFPLQLMPVF